jgi:hypothetical protein
MNRSRTRISPETRDCPDAVRWMLRKILRSGRSSPYLFISLARLDWVSPISASLALKKAALSGLPNAGFCSAGSLGISDIRTSRNHPLKI